MKRTGRMKAVVERDLITVTAAIPMIVFIVDSLSTAQQELDAKL